jgi:hypothetical protein
MACSRGERSSDSCFSNITDMEFVLRVNLDFRHWLISGGIERGHRWFRRAEFLEVVAGVSQAEVVGVGRPIAPRPLVRLCGGGNGGLAAALVAFELGQDVERISVYERIRPALGRDPDLIEEIARGVIVLLPPVQFGQRDKGGKFFFDEAVLRLGSSIRLPRSVVVAEGSPGGALLSTGAECRLRFLSAQR